MTKPPTMTCLFLDVGGVLLSNGWDHHARKRAATHFDLDWLEFEERHSLVVGAFEEGKLTLEEYLNLTVFFQQRSFTKAPFREFMFAQSKSDPEMIGMMVRLKRRYGLRIAVVSNESRELNDFRIQTFKLAEFVDFFVSSCFVHIRKPDAEIFRLALDLAQTPADQVVYIDNTQMHIQIAGELGIRGIHHTDFMTTCAQLASFGLQPDEGERHENN